jgi:predicted nucleic acid-binding protein
MPSKTVELAANLRMYTPTERMWLDSGDIVARLAVANGYEKRKIQELSFDVLIALTARSIGAAVITLNGQDFENIRQYRRFRLMSWE